LLYLKVDIYPLGVLNYPSGRENLDAILTLSKDLSFQISSLPDFRLIVDCPPTPATAPPPPANALIHPVGAPIFDEESLAS